jgi:two-component system cell cycle sensor histidine kinase/response regulator CckA
METDVQHSLAQQIADVRAHVAELQEVMGGSAPFQRELAPTAWDEIWAALESLQVAAHEHERAEAHVRALNAELAQQIVACSAQLAASTKLNEELRVNIVERKRLEAQVVQAQKLERIGRLASCVAHDLNNLLTGILGYVDLVLAALPPSSQEWTDLVEIDKTTRRAIALIRQVLVGAHQPIGATDVLKLNDLIRGIEPLLRRLISEDIALVTAPAPDLGLVRANMGQIEQVLINLVVNARDAMPAGGTVTIATANVVFDQADVHQLADMTPGAYVMLAVRDTGSGMTEAVQQRLFEPFFTTKAPGRGTGLGLATCHGIATEYGGQFHVASAVGQGTTVTLYLPRLEEAIAVGLGRAE